jgi:hypothetical protein
VEARCTASNDSVRMHVSLHFMGIIRGRLAEFFDTLAFMAGTG